MIAVFLAPVYLILNAYIFRWLIRFMGACTHHFQKTWVRLIVLAVYGFLALSILLAFFWPARWLIYISNIWFGTLCYILLTILVADGIRLIAKLIVKRMKKREWKESRRLFVASGTLCISLILSLSVYGYLNARQIHTTDISVTIKKSCKDLDSMKVVLVADLHLGYSVGNAQMSQMVRKINAQDPDLVVIAGDIFDNNYDALKNPDKIARTLRGIKSNYGVYACYGNHDIQEKILAGFTFSHDKKKMSDPRMDQFLKDANIQFLHDEGVLIDDSFYLFGRADRERPGRGISKRLSPKELTKEMDTDKPILVIDHEPDQLQELADAGVDIDLCGHTHDGQMFPGNLTIKLLWENPCGYLKKDQMHNIVTSGVGVFGPNMRVGTKSEICVIDVGFQ